MVSPPFALAGSRSRRPQQSRATEAIATSEAIAVDDREKSARPEREPANANGGETIPFDVLPPAIGRDEPDAGEAADEEPRRPRRRTRAARPADSDDEIAPAA